MPDSKKQTIVIAVLILLIAGATWFAKRFNEDGRDLNAISTEANKSKTSSNFFIEGRMGKENTISLVRQDLENIIKDANQTKEAKNSANAKLFVLLDRGTKENEIETLVKQKGFEDALCFIDDNGVELTVKYAEALNEDQANKIKDIIVRTTSISPSNIVIKYQK